MINKDSFEILEKSIIRTPLFSIDGEIDKDLFLEALLIASPNLYKKYKNFIEKKGEEKLGDLEVSINKYISRSKYRPTPFGLFGLLGITNWSNEPSKILRKKGSKDCIKTYSRLDMSVINAICVKLNSISVLQENVNFYPNNSIIELGDSYRYIEFKDIGNRRFHSISKIDGIEFVKYFIDCFKSGSTIKEQTEAISKKIDASKEEIRSFTLELIESQILVSEINPIAIGEENLEFILTKIETISSKLNSQVFDNYINNLKEIISVLKRFDNGDDRIDCYNRINEILKSVFDIHKEKNIIHVDSFINFEESKVNKQVSEKLAEAVTFLNKINDSYVNNDLKEFKKEFLNRFGDKEIPLAIALDTDIGIPYSGKTTDQKSGYLRGIKLPEKDTGGIFSISKQQACLLKIIERSYLDNKYEVNITAKDFEGIDNSKDQIPPTLAVFYKIINAESNLIQLINAGGSSANNLIGRFSYGNDEIKKLLKKISDFENQAYQNCIIAEIGHHSRARSGNVINRVSFRDFEIPYITQSQRNPNVESIPISDLSLSIKFDRLIIRSKKLNKEIIPMMGSAHNFNFDTLPVYKFLCEFISQDVNKLYLNFNWGNFSNIFSFLPRIVYKGVILSPAKWRLNAQDFSIIDTSKKIGDLKDDIKKILTNKNISNNLVVVEGDNSLNLDLSNESDCQVFLSFLKKKDEIFIEEDLNTFSNSLIRDNSSSFTNQNLAFLLNKTFKYYSSDLQNTNSSSPKGEFLPLSEWIYFKIYCGNESMDEILSTYIYKSIQELEKANMISKWFFIRYADPKNHIRLRIKPSQDKFNNTVVKQMLNLFELLKEKYLIYNISIDSYKRELLRYGNNSIELSESYFYIDSNLVIDVLSQDLSFRTKYSIASIYSILNEFEFDEKEKIQFVSNMAENFFIEHGGNKLTKISLDKKYREIRNEIHSIFTKKDEYNETELLLINNLKLRIDQTSELLGELNILKKKNKLEVELNHFVSSLIHMMINRLFPSKQRTQEFITYYFLKKELKSLNARKN